MFLGHFAVALAAKKAVPLNRLPTPSPNCVARNAMAESQQRALTRSKPVSPADSRDWNATMRLG
jgi:hypothetical protein